MRSCLTKNQQHGETSNPPTQWGGAVHSFFYSFFLFCARPMIANQRQQPRHHSHYPLFLGFLASFFLFPVFPVHPKPFTREEGIPPTLDITSSGCNIPPVHLSCHIHIHALPGWPVVTRLCSSSSLALAR
ncbi:hypothetical protein LZ30DRAFT_366420 [Colletotrichum cereale]|nr:hypothetical protein LZ30DRAFT_366420 [Colletotrichum cereale]